MIYAIILAGGSGTRMGHTEMPKQFLDLGSQPIILHTIEQFINNPKIKKVLVCVPQIWFQHTESLIKKNIFDLEKIQVVIGGSTRNDTVLAGCKFIEKEYGISEKDIVITHDAVRPFVTQRIINDNLLAAKSHLAVNTVIPATDTIVISETGKTIKEIPSRNEMYLGQTPQTFNLRKLVGHFESTDSSVTDSYTDTCKLMLANGVDVALVEGEDYNIKITTQHDLKIANAILEVSKDD